MDSPNETLGKDKRHTSDQQDQKDMRIHQSKWSFGILNDKTTDEVPGSILLLSGLATRNAPLGLQHARPRTSNSSLPSPYEPSIRSRLSSPKPKPKRTKDGKIILDPQPDDSMNDPLNWSVLRREAALFSLGFYCMVGGGMTTVLAPAFTNISETYNVSVPQVALTTGLYMMGLGVGGVIASPTAIAFGKRPVYLVASIVFILSAVWCALSPSYASLVVARVFQGIAVSPVEVLPSATVAEIFFLHERAYRVGIYTLLLLGGKNLVPLVSAAVVQGKGWRWVFWVVALIVGGCFFLLFFSVPETFWDRTPRPRIKRRPSAQSQLGRLSSSSDRRAPQSPHENIEKSTKDNIAALELNGPGTIAARRQMKKAHFQGEEGFKVQSPSDGDLTLDTVMMMEGTTQYATEAKQTPASPPTEAYASSPGGFPPVSNQSEEQTNLQTATETTADYFGQTRSANSADAEAGVPISQLQTLSLTPLASAESAPNYTSYYRTQPPKSYIQTLKPWSGRLNRDNWFRVAARPFILFSYPNILWSTLVYALSVGWLIVLSESVTTIYRNPETYNFGALQTGLVYISPFIGGILGTAVAGKVSDIVVRFMSKHNNGIYEPEFRLVMALPVAVTTTMGLMGYGWSAQERDSWIVPTVFFGIISFGCTLGSTTAITFAVDSYRQYAGEALVTLNFSKNIFHGLVFSLFFNTWLDDEGPKTVFIAIGVIQMACLVTTIPVYIYGKRARMWTVRKNLMERF